MANKKRVPGGMGRCRILQAQHTLLQEDKTTRRFAYVCYRYITVSPTFSKTDNKKGDANIRQRITRKRYIYIAE